MKIFENYIYYISFGLISLVFVFFLRKKDKYKILIYHQRKIEIILGTTLSFVAFAYILDAFISLSYVHLMLGDLCMLLGVVVGPILLIGNKSLIKTFGPWAFLGGFFTLIMSKPPILEEGWVPGLISLFKHIILLIIGLFVLMSYSFVKKDLINTFMFVPIYLVYILLTSGMAYWITLDAKFGAWSTALLKPSYQEVSFSSGHKNILANDYVVMSKTGMPYPIPSLIFYGVSFGVIFGVIKLSQFNQKRMNLL